MRSQSQTQTYSLLGSVANARSNCNLRVVRPEATVAFVRAHDEGLWTCLSAILGVLATLCSETAREVASLPLAMGGMGFRSAVHTASSALWASWANRPNCGKTDLQLSTVPGVELLAWSQLRHGAHPAP